MIKVEIHKSHGVVSLINAEKYRNGTNGQYVPELNITINMLMHQI